MCNVFIIEYFIKMKGLDDIMLRFSSGTCFLYLDEKGLLKIAPKDGKSGLLDNKTIEWHLRQYSSQVKQITVKIGVIANPNSNKLFSNLVNCETINLMNLDISQIKKDKGMFAGCKNLKNLYHLKYGINGFCKWNFYNGILTVKPMQSPAVLEYPLRKGLEELASFTHTIIIEEGVIAKANSDSLFMNFPNCKVIHLEELDTSEVVSMRKMFANCKSLESINLEYFETSKVKNMSQMFYNCQSLTSLDLENFDTNNTFNMKQMFSGCKNLKSLNIKNFDFSNSPLIYIPKKISSLSSEINNINKISKLLKKQRKLKGMFENCSSLESIKIKNWEKDKSKIRLFKKLRKEEAGMSNYIRKIELTDIHPLLQLDEDIIRRFQEKNGNKQEVYE